MVRHCVTPEILYEVGVGYYHDMASTRALAVRDAMALVNTESVLELKLAGLLGL